MYLSSVVVAVFAFFYVTVLGGSNASAEGSTCAKTQVCISAIECPTSLDIAYSCDDSAKDFKVCCPLSALNGTKPPTASAPVTTNRFKELFPDDCGLFTTDDRISGGVAASAGQFPWMALIGYAVPDLNTTIFFCGGTILNNRYILTAAHCLNSDHSKLTVRLGELDLRTDIDCAYPGNNESCADPYVDIPVESVITHPQFNTSYLKNDIGLLRLKEKIVFTEFITPVCLPFGKYMRPLEVGKSYTVSGWGKTRSSELGGSLNLQYAKVTAWDMKKCEARAPPEARPLQVKSQICANGAKAQDACKGDSGGPLMDTLLSGVGQDIKVYQVGVVSFAMGQTCGSVELPTIYTKISNYKTWILNNVKP